MISRKTMSILLGVVLLSVVFLGGLFIYAQQGVPSEANTIEVVATVQRVELDTIGNVERGILYTHEYNKAWDLYHFDDEMNWDAFLALRPGQTVFIRYMEMTPDAFEALPGINIVSLRTDALEIKALNGYREVWDREHRGGGLLIALWGVVGTTLVVLCYFRNRKSSQ